MDSWPRQINVHQGNARRGAMVIRRREVCDCRHGMPIRLFICLSVVGQFGPNHQLLPVL